MYVYYPAEQRNEPFTSGAWQTRELNMDLFPLYHTGVDGCGKIALYSIKRLSDGDDLEGYLFRKLDGTVPVDGVDEILCGHCGKPMILGYDTSYDEEQISTC